VLAFLAICLSIFIFVRCRRLRHRREALLEPALHHPAGAAGPANFPDGGGAPRRRKSCTTTRGTSGPWAST
jgi:hypothetical protein